MVTKRNSRRSRTIRIDVLGKPSGVIQSRVQAVGPERFGIVAVDCAKARSKWMLCDFYGKVLIPPTVVEHQRARRELATVQLREAIEQHGLRDHLVAVEMTGTYHRPVQRAFRKAGSETRLVHPFASRHYRLPAHAKSLDFRLNDRSPCIDAGSNVGQPFHGKAPDVGLYESEAQGELRKGHGGRSY